MAKKRHSASGIYGLVEEDLVLEDFKHIEECILDFYKNLYVADDSVFYATGERERLVSSCIPKLVNDENNKNRIGCPCYDEIKRFVFSLKANNTPGPDDFGSVASIILIGYYIEKDVCKTLQQIFFSELNFIWDEC